MTPSVTPDPRFRMWLVERAPRVAPPGLLERAVRAATAEPQAGGWVSRWSVLRFGPPIAATLVGVILVGAALLLSRPPATTVIDDGSPLPVPSSSGTPAPTSRPSPTALPRPTSVPTQRPSTAGATPAPATAFRAWTRIDMPDPAPDHLGGATPTAVERLGDGYVAIGRSAASAGAVVWTSADGMTWELREDVSGLDMLRLTDLVSIGGRLLALGTPDEPAFCCPLDAREGAWTSSDGATWLRLEGTMPSIAAVGSSGLVGVLQSDRGTTFMRSDDGTVWTAASAFVRTDIVGLAVDASGSAVAVSHVTVDSTEDDSYATHITAWRSADGSSWDGGAVVARNAVARAIVAGPDGFIVVGHETINRPDGSVFDSARIWRLTTSSGLVPVAVEFTPGQTLDGVYRIGDDLIATGVEMTDRGEAITAWHSGDGGSSWQRIPSQAALEGSITTVTDMTVGSAGIVAVGQRLDPESGHLVPVAWIADR